MRKIRNARSSMNPALMFAQGVEQIISEKMDNPTNYHDYELNEIIRKEQYNESQASASTPIVTSIAAPKEGQVFSIINLLKDLIWTNRNVEIKGG